jgi:hypothetical protein
VLPHECRESGLNLDIAEKLPRMIDLQSLVADSVRTDIEHEARTDRAINLNKFAGCIPARKIEGAGSSDGIRQDCLGNRCVPPETFK